MKLTSRIPAFALALAIVLSLFVACGTVTADAGPPEWEEGDSWAMGFNVDLGTEYAQELADLEDMMSEIPNMTLNEFDVEGNAAFWLVFEVTSVNDTHYTLTGQMGQQLTLSAVVSITGQMPDETTKTISIDGSIDYAMVVTAEIILQKDTLAAESITIHVLASAQVDLQAENVPMEQEDYTYTYEDFDVSVDFNLDLQVNLEFEPALDIFDFPIAVGDEWNAESNMTLSGTIDGILDISGLPADIEQEILSEDIFVQNGIASFPVDFSELSIGGEDGPSIHDGVIDEFSTYISEPLSCVGVATVTHPVFGQITAYRIQVDDGVEFFYSPDVQFMTSMGGDLGIIEQMGIELPFELPSDMMDMESQMGSVDPEDAKGEIGDIADFQSSLAGDTSDDDGGGSDTSSFFFKAPYFGLIIIVLVVVIVIAAVFAATRRK